MAVEKDVLELAVAFRERFGAGRRPGQQRRDFADRPGGENVGRRLAEGDRRQPHRAFLALPGVRCPDAVGRAQAPSSTWRRLPAFGAVSHRVAYNASKHGLIGLTSTLAAEWGGRGVRVNAVCPGWIKTEMDAEDQGGGAYTDSDITGQVPLARFATPEDVAMAVAFLADPQKAGS